MKKRDSFYAMQGRFRDGVSLLTRETTWTQWLLQGQGHSIAKWEELDFRPIERVGLFRVTEWLKVREKHTIFKNIY
jgi:hypothetical protein